MRLRDHAKALYEALRPILGKHDGSQVQSKLERALHHVVPSWSETTPDCPGWYWFKPLGISETQLLLVSHGRIDTKLMADLGPPNNLVEVNRIKGQWAGPLLPPS